MAEEAEWRLLLPAPVRRLPADLAGVVALVCLTNLVVLAPLVRESPLRVVLGLPFVLFVPGYAFIAALFPEAGASPVEEADAETGAEDAGSGVDSDDGRLATARDRGIDGIERVALSFGLSIAVVPLIGLVLNFTPWGIRLLPILVGVSGFTLISTAVAAHRRWELPADERFRVPYREWVATARAELFEPDTRADAALNVLLVLSLLLAVGSVGYAVAVPKQGESFSEFYVLTENETGDLVADGYPTEFTQGESAEIVVGVGNHEHQPETYQVVVEMHRVEMVNNSTRIVEREDLSQFSTGEVADNETWLRTHNVTPTMTGERLRLTYMLYRGDVPAEPTPENAYRELHLWVNVSEANGTAAVSRSETAVGDVSGASVSDRSVAVAVAGTMSIPVSRYRP
ncbi:DUF1616 domain-containing protein [Halostella salina]|uniref:DUF1616 domain-containing protein n=1 Tax=Halostella salina TaxID=1547897 RepID=UPI000EF77A8F|nr:DUF1616 domain-containing protein [Halostella salina]